jgi:hypothetical protein
MLGKQSISMLLALLCGLLGGDLLPWLMIWVHFEKISKSTPDAFTTVDNPTFTFPGAAGRGGCPAHRKTVEAVLDAVAVGSPTEKPEGSFSGFSWSNHSYSKYIKCIRRSVSLFFWSFPVGFRTDVHMLACSSWRLRGVGALVELCCLLWLLLRLLTWRLCTVTMDTTCTLSTTGTTPTKGTTPTSMAGNADQTRTGKRKGGPWPPC